MDANRHSRDHSPDRRAFRQIKRMFVLAGVVEAEGTCTVRDVIRLFKQRTPQEKVSERQIRRDLILLADLGVLEEMDFRGKLAFRYSFEGWPTAIH